MTELNWTELMLSAAGDLIFMEEGDRCHMSMIMLLYQRDVAPGDEGRQTVVWNSGLAGYFKLSQPRQQHLLTCFTYASILSSSLLQAIKLWILLSTPSPNPLLPTLHPTLQRDKHSLEPGSNMKQMLEFSNKDIKITRINMSKALTEKADNRSD